MPKFQIRIEAIVSQPFAENTYIAHLEGQSDCVVVDPGLEPMLILEALDRQGLVPAAILNTHGHGDHIGGNEALKSRWPLCPLVIGEHEVEKLSNPELNLSADLGLPFVSPSADILLRDQDRFSAAGIEFIVREIPGHSTGHIVFIVPEHKPPLVFGGDVLFEGSIGRTDFPGGSLEQLTQGIRQKLFSLPDDTIVLPGHGRPTTTGREKRSNPFVGTGR